MCISAHLFLSCCSSVCPAVRSATHCSEKSQSSPICFTPAAACPLWIDLCPLARVFPALQLTACLLGHRLRAIAPPLSIHTWVGSWKWRVHVPKSALLELFTGVICFCFWSIRSFLSEQLSGVQYSQLPRSISAYEAQLSARPFPKTPPPVPVCTV